MQRWLSSTLILAVAATWLLLGVAEADAALVEATFQGTVTEVSGSIPGHPSIGTSFSGTVRYDGEQPPVDPAGSNLFDFADGSAALTITLAGTVYGTETSAPDVEMIRLLSFVDPLTGEQVPPTDPNAVLAADFTMPSAANVDVGAGDYDIVLGWRQLPIPIDELPLPPQPSVALAEDLVGGEASVSFASGAGFAGQITLAIPEPATALLVVGGLLALGMRKAVS